MKLYFVVIIFCSFSFAEPSAFKAGDLSSNSPYGLNETEKVILNNKRKINRLSLKISKLQEKLDTVSNLFITTTSKINKDVSFVKTKIQSLETRIISEVSNLDNNVSNKISLNSGNIEQLKQILVELANLTKHINGNYVDNKVLTSYVKKDELDSKLKKTSTSVQKTKKQKNKFKNINGFNLLKKGESLISKKIYTSSSLEIFQELIKRNYKSSRSNYYLGEIYFHTNQYKKALLHYKTSVKIYSKSDFMPNLLLHSGMASGVLKKSKNAQKFFKTLISSFPKTKEAKKAKKLLAKY